MLYTSPGFPTSISEYIPLPPMEELLCMPFMNNVLIDDAYKFGTDFQRLLLDKTDFSHKKKYIYIQFAVMYLTPAISPVVNIVKRDLEWHVDGQGTFGEDDVVIHLMVNETTSMTDFNTTKFSVDVESSSDLIYRVNHDPEVMKLLEPKRIEANKITRFSSQFLHRARRTTKPEFRLFYRVVEADDFYGNHELLSNATYNGSRTGFLNIAQEYHNTGDFIKNVTIIK